MSLEVESGSRQEKIRSYIQSKRFAGIVRPYTELEIDELTGGIEIEYTLAKRGAEKLWRRLMEGEYMRTFGALTGSQAVQMVREGLPAIYLSGWQTAADMNLALATYPDQSLYPMNSVPTVVERLNNALLRAAQIEYVEEGEARDWLVPIVADAEAGFGGPLQAFELMRAMIRAGAAGVHFEDQLASEKKCGHLGGKVLVPTAQFVRTLSAARLAADVMGVPTVLIARTDAESATLLTSDIDPTDKPFLTGERTAEGYFVVRPGLAPAIARALAYAPYADMLWCETKTPDLEEAEAFASAIHAKFPGKPLAYNCSPSFNWERNLSEREIAIFQDELGKMGYRFQFITLAGWHQINLEAFTFASQYAAVGMPAYVKQIQRKEFAAEVDGYTATKHQREVGAKYFDKVILAVGGGASSTTAINGSTEEQQF